MRYVVELLEEDHVPGLRTRQRDVYEGADVYVAVDGGALWVRVTPYKAGTAQADAAIGSRLARVYAPGTWRSVWDEPEAESGKGPEGWGTRADAEDRHVWCDEACAALAVPETEDEVRAALDHWQTHGFAGGCAHGR